MKRFTFDTINGGEFRNIQVVCVDACPLIHILKSMEHIQSMPTKAFPYQSNWRHDSLNITVHV